MGRKLYNCELITTITVLMALSVFTIQSSEAQLAGSRGGIDSSMMAAGSSQLSNLGKEVTESYITIDGTVELRVPPSSIRIVLAITAEGKTPTECSNRAKARVQALRADWEEAGFPESKCVEDFIAVLPRYEFHIEKQEGQNVAVEEKTGYLMQSNLHLAVPSDAEAMKALDIAFQNDVSDIIAFDYWSDELDALKVQARDAAIKTAKEKSDHLLILFDDQPPLINLQENTRVIFPVSLYESFENSYDSDFVRTYTPRNNIPLIRLFRPKNTYYHGLVFDGDKQSNDLPMRPEISVVSTVRLYYESPAAKSRREHDQDDDD